MEPANHGEADMVRDPGYRPWLQAVHIAGSVASITGITLLTVGRATPSIPLGEVLGWILAASLLLAIVTLLILVLRVGGRAVRQRGGGVVAAYWLGATPAAGVLVILAFQLSREFVVAFVVLIVHGRYPYP